MRANAVARVFGSDSWYALWSWYACSPLPLFVLEGLNPMLLSISLSCLIPVGAFRAFGFGFDHDASIMHVTGEVSGIHSRSSRLKEESRMLFLSALVAY
ncbi:hypothetical protein GOP47_0013781 [Adiantum capillus-veneris]|uniref:Uncharacterized protein n=1 Tax=Adiantum capillus-veneris TaxID=13818 RepID=A0A9D4ZFP6_ADICA|nr:hypothetical protein GOP47_0013781 [Adiantum capillus-veneris]